MPPASWATGAFVPRSAWSAALASAAQACLFGRCGRPREAALNGSAPSAMVSLAQSQKSMLKPERHGAGYIRPNMAFQGSAAAQDGEHALVAPSWCPTSPQQQE